MQEIKEIRENIDRIDNSILELVLERIELCRKIAGVKCGKGYPVIDREREEQIKERIVGSSPEKVKEAAMDIWSYILSRSARLQQEDFSCDQGQK